ncbi:Ger(x)C family spore germination protein [Fictibacillus phosphorivorans]|uniref:Ger(x)C family spore germination protein n=1 Tax=Fictibacillus phosphorivorans TaxID=1221500 RepID=UPI00203BF967|nr:Ger(x)C family spore germination protein [Fictibacillus phosphorivorans]MCM3717791.1 Ger(x)C family spore germination protein [Fictibacillus phosphorivorans]MCM3777019.1 Ger(x)C family spore germination protein [Fictibacillus phosphorivorans]
MKKVTRKISVLLVILPLLTGCWDQRLIVEQEVVNGLSFDLEDKKIKSTMVVLNIIPKGTGFFDFKNQISSATGNSLEDTYRELRAYYTGPLTASKSRIVLFGESFAKKNLDAYLDLFFRLPDPYLGSKVAIVKGSEAGELFTLKEIGTNPIAFGLYEIIEAAESNSTVPIGNLNILFTYFNEEGKDFILPVIEKKGEKVAVSGAGLISDNSYSGKMISLKSSSLLLLFMDKYGERVDLETYLDDKKKLNNQVGYRVVKAKRKMDLKKDGSGLPVVDLHLDLKVMIHQYPRTEKISDQRMEELETLISRDLTKKSKAIMKQTQEANCDVLGIGRKLKETDPEAWKAIDWREAYPEIKINTKVDVAIEKTGILQ